jgi:hypothetical protein
LCRARRIKHAQEEGQAKLQHASLLREAVEAELAQTRLLLEQERTMHGPTKDALAAAVTQMGEANEVIAEYEKGDKRRNGIVKKTLELEGRLRLSRLGHGKAWVSPAARGPRPPRLPLQEVDVVIPGATLRP